MWLEDAVPHVQDMRYDIIGQYDLDILPGFCGGFLRLIPTTKLRFLWSQITLEFVGNVQRGEVSEQKILNTFLSTVNPHFTDVTYMVLPEAKFPAGIIFFERRYETYLLTGVYPAVIHNNWVVGSYHKRRRFREYDLWKVGNVDLGECTGFEPYQVPIAPIVPPLHIHIKVFSSGIDTERANHFSRSLRKAWMDLKEITDLPCHVFSSSNLKVDITFTLNKNDPNSIVGDSEVSSLRKQVSAIYREFPWPPAGLEGSRHIELLDKHMPRDLLYPELWRTMKENEVLILADEEFGLQRGWLRYIRDTLARYHQDPLARDPLLYGLSLAQPNILSQKAQPEMVPFSLGQHWVRSGQLIFPWAWNAFLDYVRSLDYGEVPVFGDLLPPYDDALWQSLGRDDVSPRQPKDDVAFIATRKQTLEEYRAAHFRYLFSSFIGSRGLYNLYGSPSEYVLTLQAGIHRSQPIFPSTSAMSEKEAEAATHHWQKECSQHHPDHLDTSQIPSNMTFSALPLYDFAWKLVEPRSHVGHRSFAVRDLTSIAKTLGLSLPSSENQETHTETGSGSLLWLILACLLSSFVYLVRVLVKSRMK